MDIENADRPTAPHNQMTNEVKEPKLICSRKLWICKSEGDRGCIDASPDKLTGHPKVMEKMFLCPQCHHDVGKPIMYKVQGYSVRQDFLHRNYFPLLAIFLSWSGFGSQYGSNIVKTTLIEHFALDSTRLHIASRSLKAGNSRPITMNPHFEWLARLKHEGNILIFINTHSDSDTGNLIVSWNAMNPVAVPIDELLCNYIGGNNLKTASQVIAAINKVDGAGPIIVPALNRFIKNVYVYDMEMWDAMEESFGEDRYALNQLPVFISYATLKPNQNSQWQHMVDTRVLAYNNLKDGRPWGLNIYQCWNVQCQAPAYNMIFHAHGKQYYGRQWVETKIKYTCLQCRMMQKGIPCPSWVHAVWSQNFGHVWYQWPLSLAQRHEIRIIE
ncbi:uncharacterized protein F5147DRAFT_652961 [Suillus discolor]|uniref:Uncharacterized protein n=1 Tax=Suillus discolor TaxID=1912936 RepID=A0A9P7F681_9AGAM|nr:uncharacterized protein F5147DRAFT_652961 [Suillus discolor]KAG2108241.1 hypothetical protein F5147DRAFT_652961 [Suillus discolor]